MRTLSASAALLAVCRGATAQSTQTAPQARTPCGPGNGRGVISITGR